MPNRRPSFVILHFTLVDKHRHGAVVSHFFCAETAKHCLWQCSPGSRCGSVISLRIAKSFLSLVISEGVLES